MPRYFRNKPYKELMHACGVAPMMQRWAAILEKRKKSKEKTWRKQSKKPQGRPRNDTPQNSQGATDQQDASPNHARRVQNPQAKACSNSCVKTVPPNSHPSFEEKSHSLSRKLSLSHTPPRSDPEQTVKPASTPKRLPATINDERSRPITARPPNHTPTDTLRVSTMRPPSPQIDQIASRTSPTHIKAAVSLLRLLQSRGARLQTQLDALPSIIAKQHAARSKLGVHGAPANHVHLIEKINALENMMAVTAEHWYDVLVLEYSLRDVVDEESGMLEGYVEEVRGGLAALVRKHDKRIWEVIVRVWPEAVEETAREMDGVATV